MNFRLFHVRSIEQELIQYINCNNIPCAFLSPINQHLITINFAQSMKAELIPNTTKIIWNHFCSSA